MGSITLYALYRMTVRPSIPVDETLPVAPMTMYASPVAGTAAQEVDVEQAEAEAADVEQSDDAADLATTA